MRVFSEAFRKSLLQISGGISTFVYKIVVKKKAGSFAATEYWYGYLLPVVHNEDDNRDEETVAQRIRERRISNVSS